MTRHLLRSALYVPAANEKALAKVDSLGSDVVIVDLEDSVSPEMKAEARGRLASLPPATSLRVIRVNAAGAPGMRMISRLPPLLRPMPFSCPRRARPRISGHSAA